MEAPLVVMAEVAPQRTWAEPQQMLPEEMLPEKILERWTPLA